MFKYKRSRCQRLRRDEGIGSEAFFHKKTEAGNLLATCSICNSMPH